MATNGESIQMKVDIEIIEPKLFAGNVADEIAACLSDTINEKGAVNIMLSGGSTPASVYRALAAPPRITEVDWAKVSFFFGDERWVPNTDVQSNFRMAHETLLSQLPVEGNVYPVDTGLSTPEEGAKQYDALLSKLVGNEGQIDILLLGLGEDGHTASLFPNSEALNMDEKLVCAVKNPNDNTIRISITPKVIKNSKRILFIVKGGSKSSIVKKVIQGSDSPSIYPANLYKIANGNVTWFLDSDSASSL